MSQENRLGTRIKAVADLFKNRKSAAAAAGVSTDQLARYIRDENQPTLAAMNALCRAQKVRLEWLASGKGVMLTYGVQEECLNYTHKSSDDLYLIPHYETGPSYHYADQREGEIAFRLSWLQDRELNPQRLASITVRGDAMEPTLKNSDFLLIDTDQNDPLEDGVYVIRLDHHLQAKRIQRMLNGELYIKSDNPAYTTQIIDKEAAAALEIIGRVVWAGLRL